MLRIRSPKPIGYKGQFKNMNDIYQDYRRTLLNRGPYRAYFASSSSYSPSYSQKTNYNTSEVFLGKTERVSNQQNETRADPIEQKPENTGQSQPEAQKIEQKREAVAERPPQKQEEVGGPPEYQMESGRTDIRKKRPAQYEPVESGW